jgi:4-amino-4-deoxy-L-arabinose transferase-like glycosyltransferase
MAESIAIFAAAFAFLLMLAPTAPFTRELGVCESGAVRDVLAGNVILPRFIPGPMVHVPPLYWWTAALGVHALGWSEVALRMPSIVAAALTCAIVFLWAAIALNRRVAFWAAASLLFCHFFLDAARQPRMDSMLALFVTAAAMALERALRRPGDDASARIAARQTADPDATIDPHSRRVALTLASIMIGAGILTKGILGILLPGLVVGLYLVVRRRFRDLFRIDLILTFVIGLAIGLSWYFAAYQIGGQKFLQWQLAMNLWSRFVPAEAGGAGYCAHPFWYFTPQMITGFIPWSAYLPAVAIYAWPRRGRPLPDATVFTLCCFTAIFVFFSTSHGKCLVYILPAFPPLAILTGVAIDAAVAMRGSRGIAMLSSDGRDRESSSGDVQDRAFAAAFAIATGVVAAASLAMAFAAVGAIVHGVPPSWSLGLHPTDRRFLEIFSSLASRRASGLLALIAASVTAGITAIVGLRLRNAHLQASAVLIVAAASSLFWFAMMNPALEERETLRDFAREVARTVPADAPVAHLGLSDCDLNFYSPQPLMPIYRLRCDEGAGAFNYVVARQIDFDASPVANRECFNPVRESPSVDGHGPRVLFQRAANRR